jgi:hypothetical protein
LNSPRSRSLKRQNSKSDLHLRVVCSVSTFEGKPQKETNEGGFIFSSGVNYGAKFSTRISAVIRFEYELVDVPVVNI